MFQFNRVSAALRQRVFNEKTPREVQTRIWALFPFSPRTALQWTALPMWCRVSVGCVSVGWKCVCVWSMVCSGWKCAWAGCVGATRGRKGGKKKKPSTPMCSRELSATSFMLRLGREPNSKLWCFSVVVPSLGRWRRKKELLLLSWCELDSST